MHNPVDIANYVLALTWEESDEQDKEGMEGSDITQMKLHKLLYFIQGFALALLGRPAFDEPLLAWEHGPVVRSVYDAFKEHGRAVIPNPAPESVPDLDEIDSDLAEVIDEVMDVYGQFSAWKLRNLTHVEGPWRETDERSEIQLAKLEAHFKTRLRSVA